MNDPTQYVVKYFGYIIEAILILAIVFDLCFSIYQLIILRSSGLEELVYSAVGNAFFALVLLELFEGVHDFIVKSPQGLRHVVEAGLSYIIREIIIDISTGIKDIYSLSALAIVIIALSVSLYFLVLTKNTQ
ncbi:phosphate-starvation-inducible PsiE family protein [Thermoplasma volcanium]|uniref:phosphate-starvation-inducible PsiE family protein n=1 Tax=Thermoplasma volcanium TaxID=50339 RepID=UPI0000164DD3|nr:phosphate-starvation-inducible PsiE family protein [Thermoplasma volcanium]